MQRISPINYIRIAIANHYGLDKLTWEERIDWVVAHEHCLEQHVDEADEPILMQKMIWALDDAKLGKPVGAPVQLDATASGLQIMAAMYGCVKTASNVNLVDTGKREDVYQKIAQTMSGLVGSQLTKADVKKSVMTTFYGSLLKPKEVFGEGTKELYAFYETLKTELPGGVEALNDIQSCWQSNALSHKWTLPDGHVANIKVMEKVETRIEIDELNHGTFTYMMEINQGTENGISLAANIIHSFDAWIVREMVRRGRKQGFEVVHIHDCFWCLPNYCQQLRENYRDILVEIAENDYLGEVLSEITGQDLQVKKLNSGLPELIKQSEYALS